MAYLAPVGEYGFLFEHVTPLAPLAATARFADAQPDMVAAVLEGAGRLATDILAPLNRSGDLHPARLENGMVRSSPGFAQGFRAIAEGGWVALSADPAHGGAGLPRALSAAVNEMMAGACLALQLNPLLTQGQIEALEHHASDAIKALYLPRLISGEWSGTMNLTESQAGSDVGALTTRAQPLADGSHAITGQKVFITWGDCDFTANTCHLVLARLPDGPPGTRGISLFIVPKFLPDADGRPGAANSLRVARLEQKLGIHGSPTCVMEYDGAIGWLIGAPHRGMAAMFTMMNNARLAVGMQGVGVAEAALQQAVGHAAERVQAGPIIEHPDVRRMLAEMRAEVFAARAICLATALAADLALATGDAEQNARAAFLTPIAKAWGTEVGIRVADMAMQVHGGMGYIEDVGAAQFYRDVRITAIYEGTNGIQAADLVGRKLADDGAAALALLGELRAEAEAARARLADLADAVAGALQAMDQATHAMLARPMPDRLAGSAPWLRAFALALGGSFHLRAARSETTPGPRTALARLYVRRILPHQAAHLASAGAGLAGLMALDRADLAT